MMLVAVVALAVLGAYVFMNPKNEGETDRAGVCPTDALMCPEGSSVTRSGPMCAFSACPVGESYTGTLRQQGGDFFLIIPAPAGTTEEVTYSLPVKFSRVSNVLAEFVNKDVKVTGDFSAGNTLEVNTIEPVSKADMLTGEVKVGETKYINGVRITVNKIIEDSRCPIGVMCIQAGRLVASVTLKSDTDEETLNMEAGAKATAFDSFRVSLVSSSDVKRADKPIPPDEYKLVFKVEKN